MFPPFYTDCGRNIHIGKNVFINAGCKFQDQGGIYIEDGVLIGHNAVLATINHIYMIATATENDESAFEKAYNGLQGWVDWRVLGLPQSASYLRL